MNGLAVCAGIGGLELGVRLVLGERFRTVCYIERDPAAVRVLRARIADGCLDDAPIYDDLCSFDGRPWRGLVDLVCAGLPCQPYSEAGEQLGNDDARALWPELVRVARECEPGGVFLENVPPFLWYAAPLWRELRGLGFEFARPLRASAALVGAPHLRRRLWILATHPDRFPERLHAGRSATGSAQGAAPSARTRAAVPHADRSGLALGQGERGDARAERAAAQRIHWWSAEPGMDRVADGVPDQMDRVRLLGNGVVPAVAAFAFSELIAGRVTR